MNQVIPKPVGGVEVKPDRRESSDFYAHSMLVEGDFRVVVCKDNIQWILQRRRRGNPRAGRAWVSIGYCTCRESLERLWRGKTGCFHAAIRSLPERFPRSNSA